MGTLAAVREYQDVDRARFEAEIVPGGRPALLRGLCADWPAVAEAKRSDETFAAYLRDRANEVPFETWFGAPEIAGRFGYSDDLTGFNHDRRLATVEQLLHLLLRQRGQAPAFSMYAGAIPLARHLPALAVEAPMPLLEEKRERLVSLWLGNRTHTPAHWDLPQNLACVVAGRRRFTLFPPEAIADLYVGPLEFTLAGQPISLVDVENPDFGRHPRFREALAAAERAELEPGDALYVPSLWWHAVSGLDELGAMVNFWWRDGPAPLLTPLNALYHAIMTMQALPERELAAWRSFFDHYVFRAAGDPASHLPEAGRGILGRRTPETVSRLRTMLLRALGR